MKIVITGHTKGLGLALYEHFSNLGHEVIGLSRSNGFDISVNFEDIVKIASSADCFFNNAHKDAFQAELIRALAGKTMIVTSGSVGADYINGTSYRKDKKKIEETHIAVKKGQSTPMLLLKMGYLENYPEKNGIKYETILNTIDYWLVNNRVSIVTIENDPIVYGL